MNRLLEKLVVIQKGEHRSLWLAFGYHFFLLAGYYVLQPLRDGLIGRDPVLEQLFGVSLVLMVVANAAFSWLVSRLPRRRFIPLVYRFSILCLLGFFGLLLSAGVEPPRWIARTYFLWLGVFSLFAVSVFWGFCADVFQGDQGSRLFGFVGAGGTLGQIFGSSLTRVLAEQIGITYLLLVSALLLEMAVRCMLALARESDGIVDGTGFEKAEQQRRGDKGGLTDGVRLILSSPYLAGICLFQLLYTFTSTILYFGQQDIVSVAMASAVDPSAARTAYLGGLNQMIGTGTLVVQLFFTGRLIPLLGVPAALAVVPTITALGFLALWYSPTLAVFAVVQVSRKTANYALARPAREILYTVVSRDAKYKAKSFIDTFVYRAGDAVGAGMFRQLTAPAGMALGFATVSLGGAPVAVVWGLVGVGLGLRQRRAAAAAELAAG